MRLISQDGTFDVPYESVVLQRYKDGIYWLNKNLLGNESGINEDLKIAEYETEEEAKFVLLQIQEAFIREDKIFRFPQTDGR